MLDNDELDVAEDHLATADATPWAPGDTMPSSPHGGLPETARRALTAILTQRYLSRSRNRAAWAGLLAFENDIRDRLNDLYLDLIIDRDAEVAFKRQQLGDDVPKVLRREKALSRDASFVLLFLVRECAYADGDDGPVVVTRDQIGEFLRAFREEGDSDGARFGKRVDAAINALVRPLQLLIPDPATDFLFTISPVVVPLIGADEVQRLETAYRQAVDAPSATQPEPGTDHDPTADQPGAEATSDTIDDERGEGER